MRRVLNAGVESPTVPISADTILDWIGTDKSTAARVKVTEEKISGLSGVWRSVALIATGVGSLPCHAYRPGEGDIRVKLTSGQAADLLRSPHADLTPLEFWELTLAHVLLWGNAYLRKVLGPTGRLVGYDHIHPSRVRVGRTKATGLKVFWIDGNDEILTEDRVLHIPGLGYDGICGASPVRLAREGFALALAAEQYGGKLFGSGLMATGVLQTEQRLKEGQADRLAARWDAKAAGIENAHKTVVLDAGAKFTQLSIPPEDAQFLESRSFQVTEVARWFGVPPHMLMQTEKSTSWGTGIEQQSLGFVQFTLRPWIVRVEQRVSRDLYPQPAFASFNVEGLLRGDSASRLAFYKGMWDIGALSTNDILALENRGPVEGGDMRYRPLNMGELGTSDSTTAPDTTQTPA